MVLRIIHLCGAGFLINGPFNDAFVEGLGDCVNQGLAQAVGVSNFTADRVRRSSAILQVHAPLFSISWLCQDKYPRWIRVLDNTKLLVQVLRRCKVVALGCIFSFCMWVRKFGGDARPGKTFGVSAAMRARHGQLGCKDFHC